MRKSHDNIHYYELVGGYEGSSTYKRYNSDGELIIYTGWEADHWLTYDIDHCINESERTSLSPIITKSDVQWHTGIDDLYKWDQDYPFSNFTGSFDDNDLVKALLKDQADKKYSSIKAQYKIVPTVTAQEKICWLEVFTPLSNPINKEYNFMSWTPATGETESPIYAIDPLGIDPADGNLEKRHPNIDGKYTIEVLSLGLSVDANRDGQIKLSSEDNSDATSADNPFRFWLNDDIDRSHTVDGSDTEEDDLAVSDDGKLDWQENVIPSKRDLEDFARLSLSVQGLGDAFKPKEDGSADLYVGLKWTDTGNTHPSIKLYEHHESDGGTKYLTDPAMAYLQTIISLNHPRYAVRDHRYSAEDQETSLHTVVSDSDIFVLPTWLFGGLQADNPTKHLLFEGCSVGKGQLKLVILDKNKQPIGEGPGVWMDLKSIEDFYERWTAGDGNGGDPSATATRKKMLSRSGNSVSYGTGFEYAAGAPEENKYILYVHGWNMKPEEKNRFAETAFKRLYWQGYKGRFGVFCWPTTYNFGALVKDNLMVKTWLNSGYSASTDPTNYDRGEWSAWKSSFPLMQLLTSLRSYSSVNVLAHSMGNVVAGEALRRLSHVGSSNVVDCYVASQAAVPSHTYDGSLANSLLADVPLATIVAYVDGGYPETPNIYSNWLAENGVAAGRRVNFYNVNDYALWRDVWEANQFLKPDGLDDPDQPWTYKYLGDPNVVQDLFVRRTPVWSEDLHLGDATIPQNRWEIMAFAAESRSRAVGATASPLGMSDAVDLTSSSIWPDDTGLQGSDGQKWGAHKWHSAQFRSNNMRQGNYWKTLLGIRGFNLPTTP
ncbi:MAG: alpha/beta hydrolase [Opitutaceae bacterium]|jgi:hypothetical protein